MNIGLDFGTTNSILSFYNRNTDYVETYKLTGNSGANYIPSVVALEEEEVSIGESAKNDIDNEYAKVYSRFKILLNLTDKEKLKEHGYEDKTPEEITTLYLKTLIDNYKTDHNLDTIDGLVLTIPEIWLKDDYASRSVLKRIMKNLNLPLKRLVSEPVAAGAYFLHNYEKEMQKKFDGHLLVFDYGGGTLDVSLLETHKNSIKVLERTGMGKDEHFSGRAGVAFDEKVVRTMCAEKASKLGKNYRALLNDFERKKIETSEKHEKYILNYMEETNKNRRIFKLTCYDNNDEHLGMGEIMASNLVNAFKALDKDIHSILQEISTSFRKHGVETENSDKFRVVMVGGFSNFYLAKRSVKSFFHADDNDRRFKTHFKADDIALAISKGAALIAEDVISIDETYPATLELVVQRLVANTKEKLYAEEECIPIFKEGDIVRTHKVNYIEKLISIAGEITLTFHNGIKGMNFEIKIGKDARELYPLYTRKSNKWKIGFSIDENSFIYIHIKDIYDNEIKTELGDILNKYTNSIIME